jgi:hypothetical protein
MGQSNSAGVVMQRGILNHLLLVENHFLRCHAG